jgi:hypothetical protein
VLDADAREAKLAEVLAFYDDFGRGMDGMQLPYVTRCFRSAVLGSPGAEDGADDGSTAGADPSETGAGPSDGTDTDLLLIDFR